MSTKLFTKEHEWLEVIDGIATIGISNHAQQALGDIVFVDLPEVGQSCEKSEAIAIVESVKAASDIYSPVAGEVVEINEKLHESPELVNESAENEAWFFKVRLTGALNKQDFMEQKAYTAFAHDE